MNKEEKDRLTYNMIMQIKDIRQEIPTFEQRKKDRDIKNVKKTPHEVEYYSDIGLF